MGARPRHPRNVRKSDAGDRYGWKGVLAGDLLQGVNPKNWSVNALGGSRKDRTEADVVGAGISRSARLLQVADGDADDLLRAQQRARAARRQVVLAQMDSVGTCDQRKIHSIIQQAYRCRVSTQRGDPSRRRECFSAPSFLDPQLDDLHAAAKQQLALPLQRQLGAQAVVADRVKPG